VDPDRFQADQRTYFRYTRWRSTRAVAQLLANLGASFPVDRRVFQPLDTRALNPDGVAQGKVGEEPISPQPKPKGSKAPDIIIPTIARISRWETIPTAITVGSKERETFSLIIVWRCRGMQAKERWLDFPGLFIYTHRTAVGWSPAWPGPCTAAVLP